MVGYIFEFDLTFERSEVIADPLHCSASVECLQDYAIIAGDCEHYKTISTAALRFLW